MNKLIEVVTSIRNIRASVQIKPKDEIDVRMYTDDVAFAKFLFDSKDDLKSLAKVKSGTILPKKEDRPEKSSMMATSHTEIFVPLEGLIDIEEQVEKIKKSIEKTKVEFEKVSKKLKNKNFMDRAPADVVAEVKGKGADLQEKLNSLETSLENFQS